MPIAFVLRRPRVTDANVVLPIPFNVQLDIEFDMDMNTLLVPGNNTFELVTDSGSFMGTFVSWPTSDHVRCQFACAWPPVFATIAQKNFDANVVGTNGEPGKPNTPVQFVP